MRKIIFAVFFIFVTNLYSQNGIFGFRYEFSYLASNNDDSVSPYNLKLGLRFPIIPSTYIKLNAGLSFYSEEYGGISGSVIIDQTIYNNYKILLGINLHSNGDVSHGTGIYVESYSKVFYNLLIGGGIKISPNTNIDLIFLIPTEREYGYESNGYERYYYDLHFVAKLGLEYYFL